MKNTFSNILKGAGLEKTEKGNRKFVIGCLVGVAITAIIFLGYNFSQKKEISTEEIKKLSLEYIKTKVNGQEVKVEVAGKENGLYKLDLTIGTEKMTTYATLDGTTLFSPGSALEMKKPAGSEAAKTAEASKDIQKSDKPQVELFVMSHCPYGTQIEKGIIPVVEALGDKIDFQLKFCDYAMHSEKELKEELNQYCIQKEQKDKLITYLKCFLKDENSSLSCVKATKIDQGKLSACVASTEKEFKVLENFKNKIGFKGQFPGVDIFKADNEKYGVQGSPTLIINGGKSEAGRDSDSLLTAICSGFNSAPEACSKKISSTAPAPGFGDGASPAGSNSTGAACGQ